LDDASAAAQLATLGLTATATELNILDGVTATASELNILDGATLTTTELNYVDGVTSSIQTQINGKQNSNANLTAIAGLTASGFISIVGGVGYHRDILGTSNQITVTNGDGSGGDPTVAAVVPSQAEAEAGTDNTKLMTSLRTKQAIDAQVTTPKVLTATASLTLGDVGSYAWLGLAAVGDITPGSTYAAADLRYAGVAAAGVPSDNTALSYSATALPAGSTWRAVGGTGFGGTRNSATLFVRIS
jgi:hypothetical protein